MDFVNSLNQNSGAIQAVATIVLVAITAFYAWHTRRTVREIEKQTNLQQMPIIMLFIRDIREYMDNMADYSEQQKYRRKYQNFLIRIRNEEQQSNYYLVLRNVGNGVAFNIEIKSDIFEVFKYQSRFLAPHKDEQPFAIVEKRNKKVESWDRFKGSIFEINCKDISGKPHVFKYKILEFEEKRIGFIEHK